MLEILYKTGDDSCCMHSDYVRSCRGSIDVTSIRQSDIEVTHGRSLPGRSSRAGVRLLQIRGPLRLRPRDLDQLAFVDALALDALDRFVVVEQGAVGPLILLVIEASAASLNVGRSFEAVAGRGVRAVVWHLDKGSRDSRRARTSRAGEGGALTGTRRSVCARWAGQADRALLIGVLCEVSGWFARDE